MAFLSVDDLTPFADIESEKAMEMIDDATALAVLAAPCLADPDDLTGNQVKAIKAVLRGAILRWNDSGSGALQSEGIGSYSYTLDTRQTRRSLFWPSEITQLQKICGGQTGGGVFAIDTAPITGTIHAEVCALRFGATYCSCGAILTGAGPLYENP